jgi:hypothetical protein
VRPALDRPRSFAAVAYAFAVTMLGTTLPTPLYALYSARFGFSELLITVTIGSPRPDASRPAPGRRS